MTKEVTCVNKQDRQSPYERITHIGGAGWRDTQTDAIRKIENRTESYYVNRGSSRVNVIVANSRFGHKYLKTESDGDEPNNLLSLPECR
jgi:hypothetical protein